MFELMVIFYDEKHNPVDFQQLSFSERIPAGLAKRVHGVRVEDSVKRMVNELHGCYTDKCLADFNQRIVFRVLDFDVESEP